MRSDESFPWHQSLKFLTYRVCNLCVRSALFFFFFLSSTSLLLATHVPPSSCMHVQWCNPMDCSPPGPLSMDFSRQEYWSGLPLLSPGLFLTCIQNWSTFKLESILRNVFLKSDWMNWKYMYISIWFHIYVWNQVIYIYLHNVYTYFLIPQNEHIKVKMSV